MNAFDLYFFQIINGLAGRSAWLDAFIVFCGSPLIWILFLAACLVLWTDRGRGNILSRFLSLILAGIVGGVLMEVIRFLFNRQRPFEIYQMSHQLLFHAPGGSFPSAHATFAFIIAGIVSLWRPLWSVPFLCIAALVALGRVAGGVHWPTDIIAGALLGILSAMIVVRPLRKN